MKNSLLLLALVAVASGGCQSASNNSPQFDAGMSRMSFNLGFQSSDSEGGAYTDGSGGVPSLGTGDLSNITTAESDAIALSGTYGIFLAPQVEVGTRVGLSFASTDDMTEFAGDHNGDGFPDRRLAASATSVDNTYLTVGGYSRYYFCNCIGITPWVQADFGYALGDYSGIYMGGSVGGSLFLDDSSAIEARVYGEVLYDADDITGVGIEIGYSLFN